MKVSELLSRLSYAELSNLSIGNEGNGTIRPADVPKVMAHINDGLLRIYSRFILNEKLLMLEQYEHITSYHLNRKYAETFVPLAPYPYIKDLPGDPFKDDLIKVLEVYGEFGHQYALNDKENPNSLFTPSPAMLQIPNPIAGAVISISYQARHLILDASDEDLDIEIPFVLEGALQSFVAYKIFSHMNGQENQLKAQEHLGTYDGICIDVIDKDLVNNTFSTTDHKLKLRGFV